MLNKKLLLSILISFLIANTTFAQVTQGLFAEYLFNDGTVNPTVGTVIPVNNNVTAATDRFGCPDRAMEFTNNAYLALGDVYDNYFTPDDSAFSISMWFKKYNAADHTLAMFQKSSDGFCSEDEREMGLMLRSTLVLTFGVFFTGDLNNFIVVDASTIIQDTLWHHVVVNYDGSVDTGGGVDRFEIYVDNNLETLTNASSAGTLGSVNDGTAHVAIGNQVNSSGAICGTNTEQMEGFLDDYKIYNRTLQAFEVDLLYNDSTACSSGISEQLASEVKIYPNPSNDIFNIDLGRTYDKIEVQIIDALGKIIYSNNYSEHALIENVELPKNAGIYSVRVIVSDGEPTIFQIVKN